MEAITANLAGQSRRDSLHGREHLVVPMTMIVSGVLSGSNGPLYYPADELAKSAAAWNGMPIVLGHPQDPGGMHVSARDPAILNRVGLGVVLRARVENGALKGEGWFDVERVRTVSPSLLDALERGQRVELSTGLFTDKEPAAELAGVNGKHSSWVARNHRPDHLAILPEGVGACSLRDGCGVHVNEGSLTMNYEEDLLIPPNLLDDPQATTPRPHSAANDDPDAPLELPVYNWGEWAAEDRRQNRGGAPQSMVEGDSDILPLPQMPF